MSTLVRGKTTPASNDGSFKTHAHGLADVDLVDEPAPGQPRDPAQANPRRWGSVDVREGSRTPWGQADVVNRPAPGIVRVHTPGHGGVKLSPERNAVIPTALRNTSGWYEEDAESYIVDMYHPDASPHWDPRTGDSEGTYAGMSREEAVVARAECSVRDWFPDAYEKATGKVATPENSYERAQQAKQADKEAFRAEHAHEYVTLGNGDTHATWIPKGYAACKARMDSTGEERTFLMPRQEVIHDGMYGRHALVDPNRHLDVTDIVNAAPDAPWPYQPQETERTHDLGLDMSGLTAAQRQRAARELDKQWRFRDDDGTETIESMGEHFERVGLMGKRQSSGDGKFYVQYGNSRVQEVSKAVFDSLHGVDDTTSETDRARLAVNRAQAKVERATKDSWTSRDLSAARAKVAAAQRDLDLAREHAKRLDDAESSKASAWQAERNQMQQDAFARLLVVKGVELG